MDTVRASFVPDAGTRAMRDLLRTRKQLVREQASHVQRIQKTLEDANLKLASVLTDIMGLSGRAILHCGLQSFRPRPRYRCNRRLKDDAAVVKRQKQGRWVVNAGCNHRVGTHHEPSYQ